jgi:hypothetical protein
MSRWYRAYAGTVKDDKLAEVAVVVGCSRSVAIAVWHSILESAAETDDNGSLSVRPQEIAANLGEPQEVIQQVFAVLREIGMLELTAVPLWKRFAAGRYDDFRTKKEWHAIRHEVFVRDNFTCQYCGAYGVKLQCDHVHPISKGGASTLGNLKTACMPCNQSKRDKAVDAWLAEKAA